jgi:chromosomal replication initiator protein
MEKKEIWKNVLGDIEIQISKPNFLTWFKNSELLEINENGVALVGLPNNFAKEWVKSRYHKLILTSLRNVDEKIKNVEYTIISIKEGKKIIEDKNKKIQSPQASLIETKIDPKTNLNQKYTFKNFIVGSSNELAFAAAQAVIKDIGKKYNPLFIYGGVGLGKTHLIQAVGNEIINAYKNKVNVLYVTSEKFINDVVWSIKNKRTEDMKKKYRDVDVLIIDDIQFIGGKQRTELEFFYTFNALYENNKQIIISSDRPPAVIPTLEERLRSRFEGGMIADITYPDYEMRFAILKLKAQEQGFFVEDKILEYIANKAQRNIRELEGILNKVIFYEQFKNQKIDTKKLDEIINEVSKSTTKNISPSKIISVVADFYEINPSDITNKSRKQEIVEPRQIAVYLMRDLLKMSYPHIGEKLGKRDHTTALHAYEKIAKDLLQDQSLQQKIMAIKDRLLRED